MLLGKLKKPTKQIVVDWIYNSWYKIKMKENVFFNTIMQSRKFEDPPEENLLEDTSIDEIILDDESVPIVLKVKEIEEKSASDASECSGSDEEQD